MLITSNDDSGELVMTYSKEGRRIINSEEDPNNLVMAPVKRKGYLVVRTDCSELRTCTVFATDDTARGYFEDEDIRIVEVEWEV